MLIPLLQVLFAAMRTISLSALNIMMYSFISRIFNKWLGFNGFISFFCSAYCLSKIVNFFKRTWLKARLRNKKPDEKISSDGLTWHSPTTMTTEDENEPIDKFENDWKYLIDDDAKNLFPSIVNIPFTNGWLLIATILLIDYQMNSLGYSYTVSLIRMMIFLSLLICGSTVRYQTLFERENKKFFDVMIKQRDEIERYIVYSNNRAPVGSVCLQIKDTPETSMFTVQLYQVNSKFHDYMYDIGDYMCQSLMERIKIYAKENKKSVRLIWSFPTCKQLWTIAIKNKKFILKNTYKDFSFLPFIDSHIQQYEYYYEYEDLSSDVANEMLANE
ncbi:unnamed protein product [Rotaria magnacalcarata]|uniref:Uncharacterized protein n=2 Tax=Rotaria magnacalcarata TaxID=392030 RepID=A0A814EQJ8_9BILA|nr:unnamed protein product [Rotaria magnacalcarata]